MSNKQLHITMISDFICPWCYVAKHRMQRVIESLSDEISVVLDLHPALLYPAIPLGGVDKKVFANKSKPGMGRSLRHEAKAEGITIDYSQIERIPNSLAAHRLVGLIDDKQQKVALANRIFEAYFSLGRDIESIELLDTLRQQVSITDDIWQAYLDGAGAAELTDDLQYNKDNHINIVPSLRLGDDLILPSLQSTETWERYLRRAAQRM